MVTRVVLIRHGESQAQVDGLVSGHDTCTGLSERGVQQVAALRSRLLATGELAEVDRVHTSVLPRAVETGLAVLPATAVNTIEQDCAWCEIHPGAAEGLTWDAMKEQFPPTGDKDDPYRRRLPGMETWAEMYERVGSRLRRLAAGHSEQSILIVASGGTVAASFVALGGTPARRGTALARTAVNTSITEWHFAGGDWHLIRYNDAAHLAMIEPTR